VTCGDARELIEAVASGDVSPEPAFSAHLAGCRACAAAFATAVRIERVLAALPVAVAPPGFPQAVMSAVRRQRWRYDEHVDRAFNVTIVIGIFMVLVAVVSLFNAASIAQMLLVASQTMSAVAEQSPPWAAAPSLPVGGLTAAVLAATIGIWWWAERRSDFQQE
jgi:anti-sigma factor RsiW